MNQENIHNNASSNSDEISLKELIFKIQEWWRYLLSKWVFIVVCGLIGGGLGFFYAGSKKVIYTAVTTFVLEDEKSGSGLGSLSGLASMAGVDLETGGGVFQGDNILTLYKSRSMIEKTLLTKIIKNDKECLLIDCYIDFNELRKGWSENPDLKGIRFTVKDNVLSNRTRVMDSVMSTIVNNINKNYLKVTRPDKKLSYINVQVKAPNEFFAKKFNEQIVKNVNDFYIQTKTKKSQENVSLLTEKVDSVQKMMNISIYAAAAVADATPNLNPTRQAQRIAPVQRSQISVETSKLVLSTLIQNLEMAKYAQSKETPLIQVIDDPIFPLEKEKLSKLVSLILGGMIFGFFAVAFFTIKRIFAQLAL